MHTLDIFFCIGAVFFIVVGVRRGLIGELFRLVALVVGFFAAFLYYQDLAHLLNISSLHLSTAVSFSIIYISIFLLVIGAGWVLRKIVHLTPLGWFDYIFGGAIGLAKVMIIFWVVCLSFSTFPATAKRIHLDRSAVYKTFRSLPAGLKIDGMIKVRNSLKKNIEHETPQTIQNTRKNIERFKDKVDSAKKIDPKKR
jgi:uncharacterized membrane protein required for colicin V production